MGPTERATLKRKILLPAGVSVDAEVDLGEADDEFFITVPAEALSIGLRSGATASISNLPSDRPKHG